jgi:transposase
MDRAQLKAWLEAGLSLPQIGALTNRDASTVGYWVQKYGLTANGKEKYAPRGGLTREQLEPLLERDATLQEMGDELGRSVSTIRYWLNELGLKTTGRRGRRPCVPRAVVDQAIKEGARTIVGRCGRHGEGIFVIEKSGRARCRRCRMNAVIEWRRRKKAKLVAEAGGRCVLCGYQRCDAALQFHHRDPKTKLFSLSLRGLTRSIDRCRAEAAKCELLCANCHAEVEVGFSTL